MNVWLVAAGAIAAFMAAFHVSGVVRVSVGTIRTFRLSMSAIRDAALTDEERERILRSGSRSLLADFFSIALRGAVSVATGYLPIFAGDRLGWAAETDVLSLLAQPEVILGASLIIAVAYAATSGTWRS